MKKSLIVVNQLFQLMVASQLRNTILKDAEVDLLLVDSCVGIKDIYSNIRDLNYFSNVYIVPVEQYKNGFEKIRRLLIYLFDTKYTYIKKFGFEKFEYSEIFINHFTKYACELAQKIQSQSNKPVRLYRFEEGYGSYLSEFSYIYKRSLWIIKLKNILSFISGQPRVLQLLDGHYYFMPEFVNFKTKYNIYSIPKFDFNEKALYNFITNAFSLPDQNEFDKKYIFFEENIVSADIDDFHLIMEIAEKVGKENLMVKLHPRRPVDRFSEHGIKVSRSVGIPWEAFLMKYDFSDKVIMTISSGIAFSSRLYFNSNIKTFMLFRLFDSMNSNIPHKEKLNAYINAFYKVYGNNNFIIPNDKQHFFNML